MNLHNYLNNIHPIFPERRDVLVYKIEDVITEIIILSNDYESCSDYVCKSQIKTFLEKKESLLIDLLERYDGIIR